MEQRIYQIQDFAAVQHDGEGVLGKALYYLLSNILIDMKKKLELCVSAIAHLFPKLNALKEMYHIERGSEYN